MRTTGAFRSAKPFSAARQPISAHSPPFIQAVSTATIRPVFLSDSRTMASSSGLTVRRSMTSASMPSDASCVAACNAELDCMRSADDRDVAASTAIDALADRHAVRAFRDDAVLLHEPSMLEHAHGIVVENRRQQQTLRIVRRARHHDLQARHAEQHAVDRLRMLRARSPAAADRRPHHHRHGRLAVVHEVKFRGVRHELVEGEQHEVGPVVHEHRAHPVHGRARGHTHHRFFRERRIEHALGAEARRQILRRPEHRGRIVDTLAEHEHARILLERDRQRFVHRADVRHHAPLARVGAIVDERIN